jgi:hypothetical protein
MSNIKNTQRGLNFASFSDIRNGISISVTPLNGNLADVYILTRPIVSQEYLLGFVLIN